MLAFQLNYSTCTVLNLFNIFQGGEGGSTALRTAFVLTQVIEKSELSFLFLPVILLFASSVPRRSVPFST